jgi:hypothetical protein
MGGGEVLEDGRCMHAGGQGLVVPFARVKFGYVCGRWRDRVA